MSNAEQIETLRGLLERVRGATGPDRQLDAQILCALLAPKTAFVEQSRINGAWCIYVPNQYQPAATPHLWEMPMPWRFEHAGITASVDAAAALTERALPGNKAGFQPCAIGDFRGNIILLTPGSAYLVADGRGPTAPLSILVATLSAKLALLTQEESNGE